MPRTIQIMVCVQVMCDSSALEITIAVDISFEEPLDILKLLYLFLSLFCVIFTGFQKRQQSSYLNRTILFLLCPYDNLRSISECTQGHTRPMLPFSWLLELSAQYEGCWSNLQDHVQSLEVIWHDPLVYSTPQSLGRSSYWGAVYTHLTLSFWKKFYNFYSFKNSFIFWCKIYHRLSVFQSLR